MSARPCLPLGGRASLALSLGAAAVLALAPLEARAQSTAERIVTGWADGLRAAGAEVSWSGLSYALGDDRLDLRDLVIVPPAAKPNEPKLRVTAPTAAFTRLADRAEGGFTAGAVVVPRLTMTATSSEGEFELVAEGIDQRDLVQPRYDVPAIDPEHPFSSFLTATRSFDAVAVSLASVRRITFKGKSGDDTFTGSLDGLSIGGLAGGKLDLLKIGAAEILGTSKTGPVKIRFGGGEMVGYDATAWRRLFDDRDYVGGKGDGVWRPVVRSARFDGLSLEAGGATVALGRIASAAKYVRQFEEPLTAVFDRIGRGGAEVVDTDGLQIVLALFEATRNDGWSMEALHIAGPELDHADVARVTVGAFSGEGLADLAVEGVDVVSDAAVVKLGRLALRDLRLPDGADLKRAIAAAASHAEIDPMSLVPTLGHLSLEGLETIQAGEPAIRLAGLAIDLDHYVRVIPTSIRVALSHFVVPVSIGDAEARRTLGRLGYERLDLSGAVKLAWQEQTREIVVDDVSLDVVDFGRFAAKARLADVPRTLFLRADTAAAVAMGIRLVEASLTYTDASGLDRLLKMVAEDEKTKPDRFRKKLIEGLGTVLSPIRDAARRKRIADAIGRFLDKPGTITVTARPKDPITVVGVLAGAENPGALVDLLDVGVTATR